MKRFSDFPIRIKLLILIVLSSSVALLLAMVAIVLYDSYDYTQKRVRDLVAHAEIIGKSSTAALTFNDQRSAGEYLAALSVKPEIVEALIYKPDGKIFASYTRDKAAHSFIPMEPAGYRIEQDDILLFHTIRHNQEVLGTVYLRANLERVSRIAGDVSITLVVMLTAFLAGLLASQKLQRLISYPILEIAEVARAVIERKNYTLQVRKHSDDEVGALATAFNSMLAKIQERDIKLLNINQSLQDEIEQRKQAQDALRASITELARSNTELEQFAYISSHDLQEPLRMVASYTQLLEKRYSEKFDEKGHLYLHYIIDGAKRMQLLIDDLLTFSRVGTRHKELQNVSSQEALDDALQNLRQAIQESGARIENDVLPAVMGDPTQLIQLFQNLIGNAIKFHGDQPPVIEIRVSKQNSFWQFSVQDNGIGIEREHFERIFLVFQRLHTRAEYPGTGIGLAICKKIVELHGGHIWVESQVGGGASFKFTLREVK